MKMTKVTIPGGEFNYAGLNEAQKKASHKMDEISSLMGEMVVITRQYDNQDGFDKNPAPGKVDIDRDINGVHVKSKLEEMAKDGGYSSKFETRSTLGDDYLYIKSDFSDSGNHKDPDSTKGFLEYEKNQQGKYEALKLHSNSDGSTTVYMTE